MLVTVFSLFLHKGIISPAFVEFVDTLRLSDSVQRIGHKLQCIFVAIRIDNILGTVSYQHMEKEPKDGSYNHYCSLYLWHHLP